MSVTEIQIPEHIRAQLASRPEFVLKSLNSWRSTAAATMELARENFLWLKDARDADKEFYAWEIVAAAVETLEMLASVIRHARSPGTSSFHTLDNSALKLTFASLRTESISGTEVCSLMALLLPRGFAAPSLRLARVHTDLVERLQKTVSELAGFWIDNCDNVRWWRHLPTSLTWDEALVVAPASAEIQNHIWETIEATPERIATFARLTEEDKVVEHTALRMADVQRALHTCDVATQLIVNIVSNQTARLLAKSPPVRHLLPVFTRWLAADERRTLLEAGYTLV